MEQSKIDELEETVLRLHVYLRRLEIDKVGFSKITAKIEKKGVSSFTRADKVLTSEWSEYKYYQGKMMAYIWTLEAEGYMEVPSIIARLRGFEYIAKKNAMLQKKVTKPIDDVQ